MKTSPASPNRKSNSSSFSNSAKSSSSASTNPPQPLPPTFHPNFLPFINHLAQPLNPMVNSITGEAAPGWPENVLQYHLLSENQLNNLARFFGQVFPANTTTHSYPRTFRPWIGAPDEDSTSIERKRSSFGYFIGLYDYIPSEVEHFTARLARPLLEHPLSINLGPAGQRQTQPESYPGQDNARNLTRPENEAESAHSQSVMDVMLYMEREWQLAMARAQAEQENRLARK
ncbi:hypothetical protein N7532_010468 [Penicillium argentinense]|uniref:Uncharacterized protein n=1 Tax=Penicillium argentinense TaxID=1131581 RepID=A0A9W9JYM2_9EURO|nr:uncharacterized protein N7532_010468 [Penicillium argentinense]KAJ5085697.1 hypothetical protein N7532_010468 [Penicillium argentinense]